MGRAPYPAGMIECPDCGGYGAVEEVYDHTETDDLTGQKFVISDSNIFPCSKCEGVGYIDFFQEEIRRALAIR